MLAVARLAVPRLNVSRLAVVATPIVVVIVVVVSPPAAVLGRRGVAWLLSVAGLGGRSRVTSLGRHHGGRALQDLVELAAVQPDAEAVREEVDIVALAIGDRQGDLAVWAEHPWLLSSRRKGIARAGPDAGSISCALKVAAGGDAGQLGRGRGVR